MFMHVRESFEKSREQGRCTEQFLSLSLILLASFLTPALAPAESSNKASPYADITSSQTGIYFHLLSGLESFDWVGMSVPPRKILCSDGETHRDMLLPVPLRQSIDFSEGPVKSSPNCPVDSIIHCLISFSPSLFHFPCPLFLFPGIASQVTTYMCLCSFSAFEGDPGWAFGFPWWLRWYRISLQCGRPGFSPWIGKIPWRRKWQPTLVFLPGESHGQGSLVVCSPWGHRVGHNWVTNATHSGWALSKNRP